MKQKSLKMSDSFWQAVEDYRMGNGIRAWSDALITLALVGLDLRDNAPEKLGKWGGDRRSEKYSSGKGPA